MCLYNYCNNLYEAISMLYKHFITENVVANMQMS